MQLEALAWVRARSFYVVMIVYVTDYVIHVCMFIYWLVIHFMGSARLGLARSLASPWLWANGVNANWAAAKVTNFGRLGEKVRPGTFGKIKVG